LKSEDQEQTYYTLVHGKPFVGGFFNAFPPPQYARLLEQMANFPDELSVSLLPELDVDWVLVDPASYPDPSQIRQAAQELGLNYVGMVGDQMVFTTQNLTERKP